MTHAKSKNIKLEVSFDPSLPKVIKTDETRMNQVLIQVIGNGLKFSNGGLVQVRVHPKDPGNNKIIVFDIQDQGIGMNE